MVLIAKLLASRETEIFTSMDMKRVINWCNNTIKYSSLCILYGKTCSAET